MKMKKNEKEEIYPILTTISLPIYILYNFHLFFFFVRKKRVVYFNFIGKEPLY